MAVKSRSGSSVLKFLRFVMRFLGLNGLVAAAVGVILWKAFDYEQVGLIVLLSGAGAVALALLAEVRGLAGAVASHRGFAGVNVMLQVALAAALVIGGNYYSFEHYKRFDLTEKQTFTLADHVRENLAKLRGDTDIIVYLQHVSFGQRVDLRQDEYDQAAERVIADKVIDLVEQFGEIGPRFRVHVLDKQKKTYKAREQAVKELSPELLDTIKKAPEDSIFFYSRDTKSIQRLSFNDIYHLDKKASEDANDKRGNLVLIDAGLGNFAEKVFKIEEKKPRIGFAVVHEWLGQDGPEYFGMPGLRDALPTRDFEARDIVLWKRLQVEPGALERDESRFEALEARKSNYERVIKALDEGLADARKQKKHWETTSADELNKEYTMGLFLQGWVVATWKEINEYRNAGRNVPTARITEEIRVDEVKDWIDIIEGTESELTLKKERLAKTLSEKSKLRVENLAEQRRITDVREKFNRLLADVDLLVIPRFTYRDLLRDDRIPSRVYPMSDDHLKAIKEFIKAGKPVLFCLGPMNEPGDDPDEKQRPDSLEKLLSTFEIQLPAQAVLFSSEGEAMEEARERMGAPGGASVDIPPARFDWQRSPGSRFAGGRAGDQSPIRASMRLTVRSLGENSQEGMKIRHPRPVYVVRTSWSADTVAGAVGAATLGWPTGPAQALGDFFTKVNKKLDEKTVFLMTDADSWNEEKPIPTANYAPRFKRPKPGDADKGTVQERRHGPFPIGVALEAEVPLDWYGMGSEQTPKKVRLAVIGQGGLFVGDKLSPLREKMFVDVANWLLRRDNLLAHEGATWQYPRVHLEPEVKNMWEWGARLGLPLVFVCLGMNVWLVRRMR